MFDRIYTAVTGMPVPTSTRSIDHTVDVVLAFEAGLAMGVFKPETGLRLLRVLAVEESHGESKWHCKEVPLETRLENVEMQNYRDTADNIERNLSF